VTEARHKSASVIEKLGLWSKRDQAAKALTLPERKRLEIARALATAPRILLLDEDASTGLTILLIEHVMRAVMALSRKVVVLHHGQVISSGTPDEVTRDPAVLESYLGEEAL
jgi:branched-chain amino acid transport system ATP-binding protein